MSTFRLTLHHPHTKKDLPVTVGIPTTSHTPEFLVDKKIKTPPKISINYKCHSPQEWYKVLSNMETDKKELFDPEIWVAFLGSWMLEHFRKDMEEDFKCFGQIIVPKRTNVSPLDFLKFDWGKKDYPKIEAATKGEVSDADVNRLALCIMALYRLRSTSTKQIQYKGELKRNLSRFKLPKNSLMVHSHLATY